MHKVIDLFCGCGGLSEGFKLAGYQIVGGIDFNKEAVDTFNRNFKGAKGICGDLLEMDKAEIIKQFGDIRDIDVIIGGPPCQGFSSANRWQKEMEDPRNKLFLNSSNSLIWPSLKQYLLKMCRELLLAIMAMQRTGFMKSLRVEAIPLIIAY